MPSLESGRRPPLLFTFPGVAATPGEAIELASTLAGAWLQEQNPRLLSMSTDLTFGNELWCYVITVAWVVASDPPIDRARGSRW